MLKMFVFEQVLQDYTDGMAMVVAETLEEAQAFAFQEFAWGGLSFEDFMERGHWAEPAGVYPLADGATKGVAHHVYGGG